METLHFTSIHLIAPAVAILAFLLFARGMVARAEGRRFLVLPELGLIVLDFMLRFIFQEGDWYPKVLGMLTDNGIALVIGGAYLAVKRHHPKILFVPGVILLMMVALLYWGRQFAEKSYQKIRSFVSNEQTIIQKDKNYTEILLELGPDDDISEVKPILKTYKATYKKTFANVALNEDENLAQYYTLKVNEEQATALIQELKKDYENVDNAELNTSVQLEKPVPATASLKSENNDFIANDPKINEQWALYNYQINEVHELLKKIKPKKKAKVAILDTGVDANHEDIKDVFKSTPANKDRHGHGTHCAGIAGANTDNQLGIASLNWGGKFIEILGFPALDGSGRGTVESVAQSIIDAADAGADVLSLSLGGWHPTPPKAEVDAINYALKKGCIIIVAAGNDNEDAREHSPANIEGVICVAAIDQQGKKAYFSNTNTALKRPVAAPGVDILSLKPDNNYVSMSGTSMATPLVAGLTGILRAINPEITAKDAYLVLEKTGIEGADKDKVGKTISPLHAIKAMSKKEIN